MNYDQAKELKEAGFPQEWQKRTIHEVHDFEKGDEVYYPSLSGLIEACGEEFAGLNYTYGEVEKREWEARSVMKNTHGQYPINQSWGKGTTPEIAVARLWLALKKQ